MSETNSGEKKFKVGDEVVLKCGGPCMVVEGYTSAHSMISGLVTCTWFTDQDEVRQHNFKEECLDIWEGEKAT